MPDQVGKLLDEVPTTPGRPDRARRPPDSVREPPGHVREVREFLDGVREFLGQIGEPLDQALEPRDQDPRTAQRRQYLHPSRIGTRIANIHQQIVWFGSDVQSSRSHSNGWGGIRWCLSDRTKLGRAM